MEKPKTISRCRNPGKLTRRARTFDGAAPLSGGVVILSFARRRNIFYIA
jgi:hypothetical protein